MGHPMGECLGLAPLLVQPVRGHRVTAEEVRRVPHDLRMGMPMLDQKLRRLGQSPSFPPRLYGASSFPR